MKKIVIEIKASSLKQINNSVKVGKDVNSAHPVC